MKEYISTELVFAVVLVLGFIGLVNFVGDDDNTDSVKAYFFSKTTGNVSLNGEAVEGAKVIRSLLVDKTTTDTVLTDSEGNFELPAIKSIYWRQWTFLTPRVLQSITIEHGRNIYQAYGYEKNNWLKNGETGGEALNLNCELSNEIEKHKFSNGLSFTGLCKFESLVR